MRLRPPQFTFLATVLTSVALPSAALRGGERSTVPMYPLAHLVTADVSINGRGPYRMVLDTGAGVTVLHRDLAEHLGVPRIGTVEIGGPVQGAPIVADSIVVDVIRIGGAEFHHIDAVALDLDRVFAPTTAPDGILAIGALEGCLITLDFPATQLAVHSGELVRSDEIAVLPRRAGEPVPAVEVSVGGVTVIADLDTGSPGLVSMPSDYVDSLSLEWEPKPVGVGRAAGATFEIVSSRLDGNLELGHFVLERPMISFLDRGDRVVLGSQLLGRFAVTFDNDRRLVAFRGGEGELAGSPPTPSGPKRYGMAFRDMAGDVLVVGRVDDGFPAAAAGLKAGDRIVEINATPVSGMSVPERIAALRGTRLRLVIERDGATVELSLSVE